MPVKLGKKKYENFQMHLQRSRKRMGYQKIERMPMLHQ